MVIYSEFCREMMRCEQFRSNPDSYNICALTHQVPGDMDVWDCPKIEKRDPTKGGI